MKNGHGELKDLVAGMTVAVDVPSRMHIIDPFTRMPLRSSNGDPAWIDVLSDSSRAGAAWVRELTDKNLQRRGRTQRAEDLEIDLSEKATRLTVGWNLCTFDGTPIELPFTVGNARDLYNMPEMSWLRDQVLEFSADLGNYRRRPSTASSTTPDTASASTAS